MNPSSKTLNYITLEESRSITIQVYYLGVEKYNNFAGLYNSGINKA
jgi:hypothetical protein